MARLRGFIDASVTNIQVDDTTDFPVNGGVVEVETELIRYTTATDKAILGCERGYNGTTPATHDDGTLAELQDTSAPLSTLQEFAGNSVPVDHFTGIGLSPTGSQYTLLTNGSVFVNTGDITDPVWTLLQAGTDQGINQLTGDVTAGPGNGSQVATLSDTAVTPGSYTNTSLTVDSKGRITAASSGAASGFSHTTVSTNYVVDGEFNVIEVDASASPLTITLPSAADFENSQFVIKKIDNSFSTDITFIQGTDGGGSFSDTNTQTITPDAPPSAGNLVVVPCYWLTEPPVSLTVLSVTDSAGNVFVQAPGAASVGSGSPQFYQSDIWYCENCLPGEAGYTVTVLLSGTALRNRISFAEFAGALTSGSFDNATNTSGPGSPVGPTITPTQAKELLFATLSSNDLGLDSVDAPWIGINPPSFNGSSNATVYMIDAPLSSQQAVFNPTTSEDFGSSAAGFFADPEGPSNVVTVQADGAETIDGSNTKSLNVQWSSITLVSNGTSWIVI